MKPVRSDPGPALAAPFGQLGRWSLPPRVVRVLGDPRFRLEGALQALVVGVDQTARTVEEPGILRHWNIVTGRELSRVALSDLELHWQFSPDGKWLASAADDWTLWNIPTGDAVYTRRTDSWVTALAFRPGGDWLATGHDNGKVLLWDLKRGTKIREWKAGEAAICALCFGPEGKTLAVADAARQLHLWNVTMGLWQGSWQGHTDLITGLCWHPQGRYLASTGWDTTARVWDAKTGECIYILNGHAEQVHAAAFSPRQSLLATVDSEHYVRLWDPFRGQVIAKWLGHTREVTHLAFTADGRWLLSGGLDGRLLLWDVRTGRPAGASTGGLLTAFRIAAHASGHFVAATTGGKAVHLWQISDNRQLAQCNLPAEASALDFAPAGDLLAVGLARGSVELFDPHSGTMLGRLAEHRSRISRIRFHPEAQILATAGGADGYVYLWRIGLPEPMLLIPEAAGRGFVEDIFFVPGRPWLIAVGLEGLKVDGTDGWVRLWDYEQPGRVAEAALGCHRVAVHPSAGLAAVALLDDTIGLLDLPTLELRRELLGHSDLVTALAFARDGRWLISASDDGSLKWWSPEGRLLTTVELDLPIRDLALLDDHGSLLTAHANGAICLLDASAQLAGLR